MPDKEAIKDVLSKGREASKDIVKNVSNSKILGLKKKYIGTILSILLSSSPTLQVTKGSGMGNGISTQETLAAENEKEEEVKKEIRILPGYPFPKERNPYRDEHPEFFEKGLQPKREILDDGIEIIKDARLDCYVVQNEDIIQKEKTIEKEVPIEKKSTKGGKKHKKFKIVKQIVTKLVGDFDKIREKLIKEFPYLEREEYDRTKDEGIRKTRSFNITEAAVPGISDIENPAFDGIPIPLDSKVREIDPKQFANYCHEAIGEMKKNETYGKRIKKLLEKVSEKELIATMMAFARSETVSDDDFIQNIGKHELHRWAEKYKTRSFSYYHILLEEHGPGREALEKLNLTPGQTYHPKNAGMLFLAYILRKTNNHPEEMIPITEENAKKLAVMYNGREEYAEKLRPNFQFASKLLQGELAYYNNKKLSEHGFIYKGFTKDFKPKYAYKIQTDSTQMQTVKEEIIEKFNRYKDAKCPSIDASNIGDREGEIITNEKIFQKDERVYIYTL